MNNTRFSNTCPNVVGWINALPAWRLRILVLIITLPFFIPAALLHGGANFFWLLGILAILIWQAPMVREKLKLLPLPQIVLALIAFSLCLIFPAFVAPFKLWSLPFEISFGVMYLLIGIQTIAKPDPKMIQMAKQIERARAEAKRNTPRPPVDPNRKKTFLQRQRDAKLAKNKKR